MGETGMKTVKYSEEFKALVVKEFELAKASGRKKHYGFWRTFFEAACHNVKHPAITAHRIYADYCKRAAKKAYLAFEEPVVPPASVEVLD